MALLWLVFLGYTAVHFHQEDQANAADSEPGTAGRQSESVDV